MAFSGQCKKRSFSLIIGCLLSVFGQLLHLSERIVRQSFEKPTTLHVPWEKKFCLNPLNILLWYESQKISHGKAQMSVLVIFSPS